MNTLCEEVRQLIEEISPYVEVKAETRLLEEGVLTSLEIFALLIALEDKYDIEVPGEAITREHFSKIEDIASLVTELMRKK